MPDDEPADASRADGGDGSTPSTGGDGLGRLLDRVAVHPWQSLAVAVLALLVVLYSALVQRELFLVIWLLLVAFFAHLSLRFVRAFERIAGAAERLADED